jgi:hypothetical protein
VRRSYWQGHSNAVSARLPGGWGGGINSSWQRHSNALLARLLGGGGERLKLAKAQRNSVSTASWGFGAELCDWYKARHCSVQRSFLAHDVLPATPYAASTNEHLPLSTPHAGPPLSDEPPAIGSIHNGVVQAVKPFGVFVAIEGFRRHVLVHHTQVCAGGNSPEA